MKIQKGWRHNIKKHLPLYQGNSRFFIPKTCVIIGCFFINACSHTTKHNSVYESTLQRTAKINAQLGIAYLEQGSHTKAIKKLQLALKQGPDIPEPWYSMAYYMESTGSPASADQYYKKAIKISNHRGDAENNYGTFLCRKGKYKEAVQRFLTAAKDPQFSTPADAYENAGICASRLTGNNHADEYYQHALSLDPDRPNSWIGLAEIHFNKGHFKDAESDLNQFSKISPLNDKALALKSKLSAKFKALA